MIEASYWNSPAKRGEWSKDLGSLAHGERKRIVLLDGDYVMHRPMPLGSFRFSFFKKRSREAIWFDNDTHFDHLFHGMGRRDTAMQMATAAASMK